MLPNRALQATYDKVVWVYVYRDFSRNEFDRVAERISLRFGVTSWPQLFLADPATMKILRHTGRKVESFTAAVAATKVEATRSERDWERIRDAEARAVELEKKDSARLARERIADEDIVVRTRALEILVRDDPKVVVQRANELLETPNDPFRYAVCQALKDAGAAKAAGALEALVKEPKPSLNPNVLRIRAVQALATCGNRGSVDVIAPFAQSGVYFNGLTGVAVDTLAAIAKRVKLARKPVEAVLRKAYPPPAPAGDARATRACVALAKRIHKARGAKTPFPKPYDENARARLMR